MSLLQWQSSSLAASVASCGSHRDEMLPISVCKATLAQVAAATACVGWMAVSSGLIMLNKHLMSTDGFHFPMALSCLGMLFSSVASHFCCRVQPIPSLCYLLVSLTFPPCVFRMAAWCITLLKESIPPGQFPYVPYSRTCRRICFFFKPHCVILCIFDWIGSRRGRALFQPKAHRCLWYR